VCGEMIHLSLFSSLNLLPSPPMHPSYPSPFSIGDLASFGPASAFPHLFFLPTHDRNSTPTKQYWIAETHYCLILGE